MEANISGMFAEIGLMAALCLIFGLVLVIFEMFVPGFGIPGLCGVGLLMAGILLTARTIGEVLFLTVLLGVIIGINLVIIWRSATKGKLAKTVVLKQTLDKTAGFSGTADYSDFLNQKGIAQTPLHPAGTANFAGVKLDVVSEGEYIQSGATVQVIKVEGRRILVREVKIV
jgi:membrane-bound ClpP family serine protease